MMPVTTQFMLEKFITITMVLMASLSLSSALPPRYYTEFEVSETDSALVMTSVYSMLTELCLSIPILCSAQVNVTVTGS